MILKLLKYEIKSCYGKLFLAFSAYIFIVTILMTFFRNYETLNTYLLPFGMTALIAITFLTIFKRYNSNLYGGEGYFMFTLPIDGQIILASKLISAFIWMVLLVIIIVSSTIVLNINYSHSNIINESYDFFQMNKAYTITIGLEYLINIFRSILAIYFSISISKLAIWKKFSVFAGFGTYFIIEFLNLIPTFIFKNRVISGKTTDVFNVLAKDYLINYISIRYFLDFFIFIVLFFATSYLLNNKTSLK